MTESRDYSVRPDDLMLITGATGFIGPTLVRSLLARGFTNLRCFIKPTSSTTELQRIKSGLTAGQRLEIVSGNLLSPKDCAKALDGVAVVYHLATGRDGRSYPDAFMNAVVTTRNLLDACAGRPGFRRFVSVSSLAVYTNCDKPGGRLLDETCPVESSPARRGDAYCFAKVKQDEMVIEHGTKLGVPYVIVRPGYVIGPGKDSLPSRVGIDTFGIFLHIGGSNPIPFTYLDNCADAIALAGVKPGVEGEVFNIIDDNPPSSRAFLRLYKRRVKRFRSIYLPHAVTFALCYLWERYSAWSEGQLPPAFNRLHWHAYWKKTRYSNAKLKTRLGWTPQVAASDGFERFFAACRNGETSA